MHLALGWGLYGTCRTGATREPVSASIQGARRGRPLMPHPPLAGQGSAAAAWRVCHVSAPCRRPSSHAAGSREPIRRLGENIFQADYPPCFSTLIGIRGRPRPGRPIAIRLALHRICAYLRRIDIGRMTGPLRIVTNDCVRIRLSLQNQRTGIAAAMFRAAVSQTQSVSERNYP